jgi:hypothetical protein
MDSTPRGRFPQQIARVRSFGSNIVEDRELAYDGNGADAMPYQPPLAPRRRWPMVMGLVILLLIVLAAVGIAQTDHIYIDGHPVHGFAGAGIGMLGVLIACLSLVLAFLLVCVAMAGVVAILCCVGLLLLAIFCLLLSPLVLPLVIACIFVAWLFRRS